MPLSISLIISKILDRSIIKFKDRQSASELLCTILKGKFNKIPQSEVLVLGIPRGGIVVGDIVAQRFGYDFDIIIPRRMLAPQNKEMSIGAIMKDNTLYLDRVHIKKLKITDEYLNSEKEKQLREIHKRENILGKQINPEQIKGKYIVLVDDGVATGATLIVSSRWIRQYEPRNLMVLTPICPKPVFSQLKQEVDNVESIITPSLRNFTTVEMFFQNFEQLDFIKLTNILKKYGR